MSQRDDAPDGPARQDRRPLRRGGPPQRRLTLELLWAAVFGFFLLVAEGAAVVWRAAVRGLATAARWLPRKVRPGLATARERIAGATAAWRQRVAATRAARRQQRAQSSAIAADTAVPDARELEGGADDTAQPDAFVTQTVELDPVAGGIVQRKSGEPEPDPLDAAAKLPPRRQGAPDKRPDTTWLAPGRTDWRPDRPPAGGHSPRRGLMLGVALATILLAAGAYAATAWFSQKPVTVLLLGIGHTGEYSDAIILTHFRPREGTLHVISIPRDTFIRIPDGADGQPDRVADAYARGGAPLVKAAVEHALRVPIDHYVALDFRAFTILVDSLGGVTVDVPQDMYYADPYQDLVIDLRAGTQVLTGEQALHFVRYRETTAPDSGRLTRAQDLIAQLFSQARQRGDLRYAPSMALGLLPYVRSDMDAATALRLTRGALRLDQTGELESHTLPGQFRPGGTDPYFDLEPWGTRQLISAVFGNAATTASR